MEPHVRRGEGLVESKGPLALQGLYIHIQVSKRDKLLSSPK